MSNANWATRRKGIKAAVRRLSGPAQRRIRSLCGPVNERIGQGAAAAPTMRWDVIDELRRLIGATSLTTIQTLNTSAEIHGRSELRRFAIRTTLVYQPDLEGIEPSSPFRSGMLVGLPSLTELCDRPEIANVQADIVFVDPWHTYSDSLSCLELGLGALTPGGVLVVHDCLPRDRSLVSPLPVTGLWCGETGRAFADFVHGLACPSLACVVDSDHGIGVIFAEARGNRVPERGARFVPAELDAVRAWEWYSQRPVGATRVLEVATWRTELAEIATSRGVPKPTTEQP